MIIFKGTSNTDKIREFASIMRPLGVELRVTDLRQIPEETGTTLEANAIIKAKAYAQHVRSIEAEKLIKEFGCTYGEACTFMRLNPYLTASEDSGLEISALDELPGPWSARFDDCQFEHGKVTGHQPSARERREIDEANVKRVLALMKDIKQPYRAAAFGICLVVADTDGNIVFQTSQRVTGWIADESRGTNGFGYDSIFISDKSFKKTWAEIDSQRKSLISHRRLALRDFTLWLASQIKKERCR